MPRKQKERFTPEFEYKYVSYVCPECRVRRKEELPYIPTQLKTNLEKGRWCNCGARHRLKYGVRQKRTGEIVLKVVEFSSNETVIPRKRFRRLN